jgi:hypothetical protein
MSLSTLAVEVILDPVVAPATDFAAAMDDICTELEPNHPFVLYAAGVMKVFVTTKRVQVPDITDDVAPFYNRMCEATSWNEVTELFDELFTFEPVRFRNLQFVCSVVTMLKEATNNAVAQVGPPVASVAKLAAQMELEHKSLDYTPQ